MRNCREKKEEVGDLWFCIETYLLLGILATMKLLGGKIRKSLSYRIVKIRGKFELYRHHLPSAPLNLG